MHSIGNGRLLTVPVGSVTTSTVCSWPWHSGRSCPTSLIARLRLRTSPANQLPTTLNTRRSQRPRVASYGPQTSAFGLRFGRTSRGFVGSDPLPYRKGGESGSLTNRVPVWRARTLNTKSPLAPESSQSSRSKGGIRSLVSRESCAATAPLSSLTVTMSRYARRLKATWETGSRLRRTAYRKATAADVRYALKTSASTTRSAAFSTTRRLPAVPRISAVRCRTQRTVYRAFLVLETARQRSGRP